MQGGRGGSNIVVDGSGYAACGSAAAALDLVGAVDSKDISVVMRPRGQRQRETRAADGKEAQLGWRGADGGGGTGTGIARDLGRRPDSTRKAW
uniref:Uncharacterized protein n=1 Tax=Oryza sativa subsp. indica TaxID=39946 RepID=A0A679AJZ3_ORYSI|nr:hypothetical protein [Oryza sativa Indica Group]